ncbi:unnamed protein product [Caenorhabditis sp. 36 PRJEB53466]|nr:unnamed protein product [Caenorhabditis sp. 36 PRJEB53466]
MGGSLSRSVDIGAENEIENDEDPREILSKKLIFLRDSMIQMRGQLLHFQHVYKYWQSDIEQLQSELKILKMVIMVIHKSIEDVKAQKNISEQIMRILKPRVDEINDVMCVLMLEIDQYNSKTGQNTIDQLETLMNKLNPFDIPNVESLEEGSIEEPIETDRVLNSILKQHSEKHAKQLDKIKTARIQIEEETEVCCDNVKIERGNQKISTILRKPVVLFVNNLDDEKTLETLRILNQNKVDYSVFDVAFDAEDRMDYSGPSLGLETPKLCCIPARPLICFLAGLEVVRGIFSIVWAENWAASVLFFVSIFLNALLFFGSARNNEPALKWSLRVVLVCVVLAAIQFLIWPVMYSSLTASGMIDNSTMVDYEDDLFKPDSTKKQMFIRGLIAGYASSSPLLSSSEPNF